MPTAAIASRTSSSLNGLMIAVMRFMFVLWRSRRDASLVVTLRLSRTDQDRSAVRPALETAGHRITPVTLEWPALDANAHRRMPAFISNTMQLACRRGATPRHAAPSPAL